MGTETGIRFDAEWCEKLISRFPHRPLVGFSWFLVGRPPNLRTSRLTPFGIGAWEPGVGIFAFSTDFPLVSLDLFPRWIYREYVVIRGHRPFFRSWVDFLFRRLFYAWSPGCGSFGCHIASIVFPGRSTIVRIFCYYEVSDIRTVGIQIEVIVSNFHPDVRSLK